MQALEVADILEATPDIGRIGAGAPDRGRLRLAARTRHRRGVGATLAAALALQGSEARLLGERVALRKGRGAAGRTAIVRGILSLDHD